LGPYLTQLLQAVAFRLSAATKAFFIQSLILVFARLCLHSPSEVIAFLAQIEIGNQSGLQVVLTKWLENSVNFAGYEEINQNVIALSNLYELDDTRLSHVQVKGDLVVPQSDRIMTRSRARQTPDQYTTVPANLKIIKVLIDELLGPQNLEAQAAATASGKSTEDLGSDDDDDDDDEDNDDWEDEPNGFLDLGAGVTKEQLMSYAGEGGPEQQQQRYRGRGDDETQTYLLDFFRRQAERPGFAEVFQALTPREQEKLRNMS